MLSEEYGGSSRGRKIIILQLIKTEPGVKTESGRKGKWMLNPGKYFAEEKDIFMILKCLLTDRLLVIREEIVITK